MYVIFYEYSEEVTGTHTRIVGYATSLEKAEKAVESLQDDYELAKLEKRGTVDGQYFSKAAQERYLENLKEILMDDPEAIDDFPYFRDCYYGYKKVKCMD